MPYIDEKSRKILDQSIDDLANVITNFSELENEDLVTVLGDLNYCMSRLIGQVMGSTSYAKVAMLTGVLENVKQEFYRRVAVPYEEEKIVMNGDIKEYKNRHLTGKNRTV
jgi:predicted NBD/HSP70 family sugar kinase